MLTDHAVAEMVQRLRGYADRVQLCDRYNQDGDEIAMLLALATMLESLAAERATMIADACEDDAKIREVAKRVLPAALVDGDSHFVPGNVEIVEAMADRLAGSGGAAASGVG